MRINCRSLSRLIAAASVLTLTACGGCGEGNNNGGNNGDSAEMGVDVGGDMSSMEDLGPTIDCVGEFSGNVVASEYMGAVDVDQYEYTGSLTDNELAVSIIGGEREEFGTMLVEQVVEDEAEFPRGTMRTTLDVTDGVSGPDQVELISRGDGGEEGYAVRTTLRADGSEVDVVATYDFTACAPEVLEGPCGAPRDFADDTRLLTGSCGLVFLTAQQFGLFPRLESVRYEVRVRASGDERVYTYGVMSNGRLGSGVLDDLDAWLADTGVGDLVGTRSVHLLSMGYADTVWRDAFEEHAGECSNLEGQGLAWAKALDGCHTSAVTGIRTHRQAQVCESAARRDEEAWAESTGEGGNDGGEGNGDGCSSGCSEGDPHMTSFDGKSFDFQGAGEYVLGEATSGSPFHVQVRMEPMPNPPFEFCRNVTVNTAVAFELGAHRIGIYSRRDDHLWVDGAPVEPTPDLDLDLPEGAGYEVDGSSLTFWWPTGEMLQYRIGNFSGIELALPDDRSGEIAGILGTFSGSKDDDFTTRQGETLPGTTTFEELYRQFGDSWRVAPFESLFDYEDGEGTETYTIDDFPEEPVGAEDIPESERADAVEACQERGINDPWLFDSCLVDVVCSGDPTAADGPGRMTPPEETTMVDDVSFTVAGAVKAKPVADAFEPGDVTVDTACRDDIASFIWLVPEQEAVTLTTDVSVDAVAAGNYDEENDLTAGSVASGAEVWSYLLHYDLDGRAEQVPASGSVEFSAPIVGVIVEGSKLASTDATLGVDGATHSDARTIEFGDDVFEIAPDGHTLAVKMRGEADIDQLRVLVMPEPEEEMP